MIYTDTLIAAKKTGGQSSVHDMEPRHNINLTAFLRDLFFVETECTLSFAIIGTIFARGAAISYAHFFIPLVLGVVCMIPCLPVYLKEDMTIPQVIAQRVAELVVLEAVFLWAARLLAGAFLGAAGLCAVAASVLFFDAAAYFFMYRMEKAEAARLNKKLQSLMAAASGDGRAAAGASQPPVGASVSAADAPVGTADVPANASAPAVAAQTRFCTTRTSAGTARA